MIEKSICIGCANLIHFDYLHHGLQADRMVKDCYTCQFALDNRDYEIKKCSHFKKKIVPDKKKRAEQLISLHHGKLPREQPKDVSSWKRKGLCDFCSLVLTCDKADLNVDKNCKDWKYDKTKRKSKKVAQDG